MRHIIICMSTSIMIIYSYIRIDDKAHKNYYCSPGVRMCESVLSMTGSVSSRILIQLGIMNTTMP